MSSAFKRPARRAGGPATAVPRARGRPAAGRAVLSRELIVLTAAQLVESEGWARLSMRALAQALGVDPMALYHHVPGKAALLEALAEHQFAGLDATRPPFDPRAPWPRKLEALAGAYLERIAPAPELVRTLARTPAAADAPAHQFSALLRLALADAALDAETLQAASDLLVDYLHGYALAPAATRRTGWRRGVQLIAAGLAAPTGARSQAGPALRASKRAAV